MPSQSHPETITENNRTAFFSNRNMKINNSPEVLVQSDICLSIFSFHLKPTYQYNTFNSDNTLITYTVAVLERMAEIGVNKPNSAVWVRQIHGHQSIIAVVTADHQISTFYTDSRFPLDRSVFSWNKNRPATSV